MKKLFLAGMLCLAASATFAQHSTIKIINNTACDVYLELYGDVTGSTCATYNTYASAVFSVPAFSAIAYDPSTVPGGLNCGTCTPAALSSTDIFWATKVYKGYPCAGPGTTTFLLQDNGCISNPTVSGFTDYDATCTPCSLSTTVTWTDMGSYIDLTFF